MRRRVRTILATSALALCIGCQSAVIVQPKNDEKTQTVVTVEDRPKSDPQDKDLTVIDKR
jgi:ABC-type uncharacterized transport system substrate-binding protein